MKKKTFLSALFVLSIATTAALSGCSTGQGASTSNHTNKETTTAASNEKGTLVIARQADASKLDPHFLTDFESQNVIYQKVYETLVQQDKDMNIQPQLATEWKQLNDTTWEFKLQQGISFHDGTPFNAQAVQKTFQRVLDPQVGAPQASDFEMIKEVKVVDDYTFQFILKYPFSPLFSILASNEASILSPKAIEQYGRDLAKNPVGTGPFVFESWKPGQEIVLSRNDNYWGKKAKVEKVVFKVVPEDATRVAMVETGEAHIAEPLPVTEVERVKSSSSMTLYRNELLEVAYIGFNLKKKPLDDVRVRQAISYAIDKESLIKGVYNDIGKLVNTPMSSKVLGFTPDIKGYPYDLNKAKELLAEAGYANGFKTSILTIDLKDRINVAEVIQSQLKGIGIDLQIVTMESGAYFDAVMAGKQDLFLGGWGNATGDGDYNQFNLFHSSSQGFSNRWFYSNPEVDKLIEQGRRETDIEQRKKIYAKAQEIEINDAVLIPYRNPEILAAVSKNVKGFWINPVSMYMLHDVSIE
ncbi:glutathione ABC transporter substrate-binding protein [Brevibacillus sp. NRS-1366]|uniref:glutathione ABC transporter substrate-binding protein n=1 Tax=Brevibacillus sp. NRS-1366 TaxID=3233899 RepID=UPI003D21F5D5